MGNWSVELVQRTVLVGAKQGAALAARDASVRSAAPTAALLAEAFPGEAGASATAACEPLLDRVREALGADWKTAEAILTNGLRAALVLGARAITAESERGTSTERELLDLAEDELWLAPQIGDLLAQMIGTIVAARIPLRGARGYLHTVGAAPAPPRLLRTSEGAHQREIRTDWISDPDTAMDYQWRVQRRGNRLVLSKRRRGEKRFRETSTFCTYDSESVMEMIRVATA